MPDYKPCHCGANCDYFEDEDEPPCWGEVNPVDMPDGDEDWRHACQGHANRAYEGGDYVSPPNETVKS